MQFSELYGAALDHELGSYDTTQLFTTARRKYAINRAHKEFARLAKISLAREVIIPLVTGTARYDLDDASLDRFVSFGRPPLRLRHTVAANGTTSATSILVRSVAYLDEVKPGWRDSTSRGVPENVGHDPVNGVNWLVCLPIPAVTPGETWDLIVPIQANAADMQNDADLPFDGRPDIEPFHWGLAHFAASVLERLRKDPEAEQAQVQKFGAYLEDWNAKSTSPPGAHKTILKQRDYLGEVARRRGGIAVQDDPRR